ncbi:STAS domain-containing protein [Streptomyces sp. NPDC048606]|uniref:STAS domain-containing protein n=1 Tax=Streptomyces sp. NPDC048606 TaxID=3154726 RepID=UPI00341CC97F
MQTPTVRVRSQEDGRAVVECAGEFDIDSVDLLRQACAGPAADAKLLVLDVARVEFADSSFLNELIRLRQERELALAGPLPRQLRRLLEMTGALALFEIRDDTAAG